MSPSFEAAPGISSGQAAGVAPPSRHVDAGDASSLVEGGVRTVVVDGRAIGIWRIDGVLRAYAGTCLHRGGPLTEGVVRGGIVTCPWHWWRYDLRSGSLVGAPGVRLPAYPVAEVDGRIVVEVPPSAPASAAGSIRGRLLARARASASPEAASPEAASPEAASPEAVSADPRPARGPTAAGSGEEVRS